MKYSTSDIKNGLKVLIDGEPCIIIENEFEKPGKGQAFTRVKLKHCLTGRVLDRTYKSGQSIPQADVQEQSMVYLYTDGESLHFMDPDSYEQTEISERALGDAKAWLKEQCSYQILFWNQQPVSVTPENFMTLEITDCEPNVKGNSQSGIMKNATVETGATIKVPLFIKQGDKIKVDTRIKSYIERVNS
tara:strand:+ start:29 stop:595 length:567 start_codon:yes stop_codon:yes gene_type:complete